MVNGQPSHLASIPPRGHGQYLALSTTIARTVRGWMITNLAGCLGSMPVPGHTPPCPRPRASTGQTHLTALLSTGQAHLTAPSNTAGSFCWASHFAHLPPPSRPGHSRQSKALAGRAAAGQLCCRCWCAIQVSAHAAKGGSRHERNAMKKGLLMG